MVGDGHDKTALLNNIFARYGGASYYQPPTGDVILSGQVNLPSGATITLAPDAVWNATDLRWTGTIGSEVPLTAPALTGTPLLSVDTTGLAVDDWIFVKGVTNLASDDAGTDQLMWPGGGINYVYAGQFFRIKEIASGLATVWGGTRWNYAITAGADSGTRTVSTAAKVNFATGKLLGGTIKSYSPKTRSAVITATWCKDLVITTKFDLMEEEALSCAHFFNCLGVYVTGCDVIRPPFTQSVGGISLRNSFIPWSCTNFVGSHNTVDGGAQTFDISVLDGATPCMDCSWVDNVVRNALQIGTSHEGSTNIRIDRNFGYNLLRGIRIRTPHSSASFNTMIGGSLTEGIGLHFSAGFNDGSMAEGNIISGFLEGVTVDYSISGGHILPCIVTLKDNDIRGNVTNVRVRLDDQVSAQTQAVIYTGGQNVANPVSGAFWMRISPYANGLTVSGVRFSGQLASARSGVIELPLNTARVTIGRNTFEDVGATTAGVYGPGTVALTDATTFPAGDSEALWRIDEQLMVGTTGDQTDNMPTSVDAYAPGNPLLWTGELGKLRGINATAASIILSTATTVAHIVEALNQLIYPLALPFRQVFDFMPGTMPTDAALTRASVGWSLDDTGDFISNAINVERFQYDADGDVRGLLCEPAQTNLLWNSQTLTGTQFTVSRSSLTANATTDPTGAVVAPKLVEDTTATNNHTLNIFSGAITSGLTYSISFFAKAAERTRIRLRFATGFTSTSAFYDLTTGLIDGDTGGGVFTIEPYPNDWYLCTGTAVAASSVSASALLEMVPSGQITSYTGDGTSGTYVWGATWTEGQPGSYIDTTTVAVTRSADVLTLTVPNSTYDIDMVRESGVTTVSGVVIGGGTYVVPTDVSPLKKVAFR